MGFAYNENVEKSSFVQGCGSGSAFIKEKTEMEKKRQVDEDKVRKRATERDANRNGRSDMFMNSLRILQERRLADRTVMKRLEVQRGGINLLFARISDAANSSRRSQQYKQ